MKKWIAGTVAVVVVLVTAGFVLNPFGGQSVEETVADWAVEEAGVTLLEEPSCDRRGFQEAAGEREKAYNCSYPLTIAKVYGASTGKPVQERLDMEICASIIDGQVYARSGPC